MDLQTKALPPTGPIEIPEDAELDPGPGRVLVRLADSDEMGRYGQIWTPTMQGDRQFFGRVEKISSLVEDAQGPAEEFNWLLEGDIVFFGKYSGTEMTLNRKRFVICRETDILARVRTRPKLLEDKNG